VQGKITDEDTLTIHLGATPSGLIRGPPPSSPHFFTADALPATTLPLYSALGQAPNVLACIPSGVVCTQWHGSIPSGMVNTQWRSCITSGVVKMCSIMIIITHPFVRLTKAALRTDSALLTVQVAALMDVDRLCKMMRF